MRAEEAKTFLDAFKNDKSKRFVQKTLKTNYAEAILSHHPDAVTLNRDFTQKLCNSLVDFAFSKLEEISDKPESLFPVFYELSRGNASDNTLWFKEFVDAYHNYKHNRKLTNRLAQLEPYLDGSSYCDIGCGGGDLIMFLKNNHPKFEDCAGIDVLDWRTEAFKDQINFQMLDFSKPNTASNYRYDTLTCLAVLHHVGYTEEAISIFLQNIHTAMKPGAKLIIEEDVILPAGQITANRGYKEQISRLKKQQPLFAEFLEMNKTDQLDAIILIDILANCLSVGVPEMAFPCGFRTIDAWTNLFSLNNFRVEEVNIQGYVEGNFNRSSHVFFVLSSNQND